MNKTITLPSGKTAEYKESLTNRERRSIDNFPASMGEFVNSGQVDENGKPVMNAKLSADALNRWEDLKIETVFAKIEDQTNNLANYVMDYLSYEDYKECVKVAEEIISGEADKKKS